MARANQAGSFGPSGTRTSLVVYRIAVETEEERQGMSPEARSDCTVSVLMQIMCGCCSPDKKIQVPALTDVSMRPHSLVLAPFHCFFWPTPPEKGKLLGMAGMLSSIPSPGRQEPEPPHLHRGQAEQPPPELPSASCDTPGRDRDVCWDKLNQEGRVPGRHLLWSPAGNGSPLCTAGQHPCVGEGEPNVLLWKTPMHEGPWGLCSSHRTHSV